jgi:hypothetical protein
MYSPDTVRRDESTARVLREAELRAARLGGLDVLGADEADCSTARGTKKELSQLFVSVDTGSTLKSDNGGHHEEQVHVGTDFAAVSLGA